MARPRGSKNKAVEAPMPKEFDYERDDMGFDGAYQATTNTLPEPRIEPSWTLTESIAEPVASVQQPTRNRMFSSGTTEPAVLYLVEGDVQLSSREPGRGSMVAKQTRLVRASSDSQAIEKFSLYFRGLSDNESAYSVVRAAAMETIK